MKKLKGDIARKECMVKAMQAELDKVCFAISPLQGHEDCKLKLVLPQMQWMKSVPSDLLLKILQPCLLLMARAISLDWLNIGDIFFADEGAERHNCCRVLVNNPGQKYF